MSCLARFRLSCSRDCPAQCPHATVIRVRSSFVPALLNIASALRKMLASSPTNFGRRPTLTLACCALLAFAGSSRDDGWTRRAYHWRRARNRLVRGAQRRLSSFASSARSLSLVPQAKLFLDNGYRVFLSDVNLEQARKELGGTDESRIGFLETDVTKEDQVRAMSQVRARLARFACASLNVHVGGTGGLEAVRTGRRRDHQRRDSLAHRPLAREWVSLASTDSSHSLNEPSRAGKPEDLDRMLDINVKGAWLTCKHAAQAMVDSPHKGKGGSIVFVASVASL